MIAYEYTVLIVSFGSVQEHLGWYNDLKICYDSEDNAGVKVGHRFELVQATMHPLTPLTTCRASYRPFSMCGSLHESCQGSLLRAGKLLNKTRQTCIRALEGV